MTDSSATHQPGDVPRSEARSEPGDPVPRRGRAPRSEMASRLSRLGSALMLVVGSAAGATLATFWITSISVIALGVGIPLTLLATLLVRWFADMHRRWAADRLGEPVTRSCLPAPHDRWPVRLWTILRDPASWRDWAWLVANSITVWFTCGLSLEASSPNSASNRPMTTTAAFRPSSRTWRAEPVVFSRAGVLRGPSFSDPAVAEEPFRWQMMSSSLVHCCRRLRILLEVVGTPATTAVADR